MKKLLFKAMLGASTLLVSAAGFANGATLPQVHPHQIYMSVQGGYNNIANAQGYYKDGFDAGAALGLSHGPWRLETAFTYYRNDINIDLPHASGSVDTYTVMVNGYYDFIHHSRWTPYLGAGIGWAHFSSSLDEERFGHDVKAVTTDDDFAYQGLAGVKYSITPKTSLGLEYAIMSFNNSDGIFYNTVNLKLAYRFGAL